MAKKKQLIIPIFIPFLGCDHKCVFCNQADITGVSEPEPKINEIKETIETYLATWKGHRSIDKREVAFYGGSFTGLSFDKIESFLKAVYDPFIIENKIDNIRCSTRPDYINEPVLALLKKYKATTIELGVQSTNDNVLKASLRGHGNEDTIKATKLLKEKGFTVGHQLMPGLPKDNKETFLKSVEDVMNMGPDFVRIYPTLVIKDTALNVLYERGDYSPWQMDEMIEVVSQAMKMFEENNIKVIRVGLQHTKELEESIVAGPYSPSFRSLVQNAS